MKEPATELPWKSAPIREDVEFAIHAANAYPRLVEALERIERRGCAPYPPPDAEVLADIRHLARTALVRIGELEVIREWHYPKDTPWPDGKPSYAAADRLVECPKCGAPVGAQCQTRAGKNTGTHGDRWVARRAVLKAGEGL